MNYSVEIYKELRRRGISASNPTKDQLDAAALAVRTIPEKVRAISAAVSTHLNVSFAGRVVSLAVLAERTKKCQQCSSHSVTDDGIKWCTWCGCSGPDLEAKQRDADQMCPKPEPEWKAEPQ